MSARPAFQRLRLPSRASARRRSSVAPPMPRVGRLTTRSKAMSSSRDWVRRRYASASLISARSKKRRPPYTRYGMRAAINVSSKARDCALELVDRRPVFAAEVLHVLDFRAAPPVHTLIVVADDERGAGLADELADPVVLDAVRVLELVHEDVAEAVAVVLSEVGHVAQDLEAAQHELREIDDARRLAARLVELVQVDQLLARRVVAVGEVL